jgi:hypothetical protein
MQFEPPPESYIRYCQRLALQGLDPSLPIERNPEPTNVHSIEAARTQRCIRILGEREFRERPL